MISRHFAEMLDRVARREGGSIVATLPGEAWAEPWITRLALDHLSSRHPGESLVLETPERGAFCGRVPPRALSLGDTP